MSPDDFDHLEWSKEQIQRQGDALVKLMLRRAELMDQTEFRILHTAIGQLAQVHRALTHQQELDHGANLEEHR